MLGPIALQSFRPYLAELARFESTNELERSSFYQKLKAGFDAILDHVWQENFAHTSPAPAETIDVVAWNIERGICVDAVIQALRHHPSLSSADVLLLSELDWGMARTNNRFVARE